MAVKFTKPEINVREKLSELDKPSGIAGEAMLRAETPQEQFNLIGAGRRNLIINGDMRVWQRGTSIAEGSAGNGFSADRWAKNGSTGVVSRSTDVPSGNGFSYSMKQAPSGGGNFILLQPVELPATGSAGLFEVGTTFTFSFWVKGNASDSITLSYDFRDVGISGTNYVPATTGTTVNYTSSWTRVVHTFTITGTPAGTNKSFNPILYASTTSGEELYITGIQLELGKVATPFEHRSYGEELALCQRYFTVMPNGIFGIANNTTSVTYSYHLPTQMRATPSVSLTSTNQRQGDTVAEGIFLTSATVSSNQYSNSTVAVFAISGTPTPANFTAYRMYLYESVASHPAQVHLSAEL